jgi:uncharacterized ion transporter superfamily protein YfcC
MWLSAIKLAVSAGSKIYANKQRAKVAMSDAQLLHAERQARGEEAYQGKLLEARQNDYKDEFVLVILSAPIIVLAWGVFSDNPVAMEKVKSFSSILRHSRHGSVPFGFLSSDQFLELREHKSF